MLPASRLLVNCALVLDTETILGDASRALRVGAISRRKIEGSSTPEIAGYIDEELHRLDVRVEEAMKTEAYWSAARKLQH